MDLCLKKIKKNMFFLKENPALGESPNKIMKNYSKFVLGGTMNGFDYRPRCLRVIYNPIWDKDLMGARKIFIKLAQFRNIVQGYNKNFAIHKVEKNLWTASRIQHYPAGGGFFSQHKDFVLNKVTSIAKIKKFIQIILLVTSKGKDFESGGAYIINKKNKKIDLETQAKAGSIILYNSFTEHGVDEIDPNKAFKQNSADGRIALLASLYKNFEGNRGYGQFKKEYSKK